MFKLAIENTIRVPVRFDVGGKSYSITLLANRLGQQEIADLLSDGETQVSDFLRKEVTGWEGNALVLDESGSPAPYSTDALSVLLSAAGLPSVCFAAYLKACGAREKN